MSKTILVGSTPITIPLTGDPAVWSEGIVAFMEAAAANINAFAGPYDVPPQVINIDAYNPTTSPTNIDQLTFPIAFVRSVTIYYSLYRSTSSANASEQGTLNLLYDPNFPVTNKWSVDRDFQSDGKISFIVTDTGQVQFETTTLAGTGHTGNLSIYAKALLQS